MLNKLLCNHNNQCTPVTKILTGVGLFDLLEIFELKVQKCFMKLIIYNKLK